MTVLRKEIAGMTVLVRTVIARRFELSKKVQAGLRRSNLLAKGNLTKKGFGKGGTVLSKIVLAYMGLRRRSRTRLCF